MMKADKQLWTRIGVVAAVLVILYCMYKLRSCKDTYAELDYESYYEEGDDEEAYEDEYEEGDDNEYEEEDEYEEDDE